MFERGVWSCWNALHVPHIAIVITNLHTPLGSVNDFCFWGVAYYVVLRDVFVLLVLRSLCLNGH
jgi:hypothetical protein